MRTARVTSCIIATCTVALFCGGKEIVNQPEGHAAPDGAFVGDDGGLVITPSVECIGFEADAAAAYGIGGGAVACENDGECFMKAASVFPQGFPVIAHCADGRCVFGEAVGPPTPTSLPVYCHSGIDGDAFCSAFYSQFVNGTGSAHAKCVIGYGSSGSFDGLCAPDFSCFTLACDRNALCVTRNALTACELPCQSAP
jgi:hypothetical protein